MSFLAKLTSAFEQLLTTTDPAVVTAKQQRRVKNILWREWRHGNDPEYAQQLSGLVADVAPHQELRTQDRPLALEVETALRQACQLWPKTQDRWAAPLHLLDEQRRHLAGPDQLLADLHNPDWVKRFVARQTLLTLGGEAVPQLTRLATDKKSPLREVAIWLLRSIEAETTARLSAHFSRLLCPRCLVRFYANQVFVPGLPEFVYYGCRACGQGREFLEWTGDVVAVLDEKMETAYVEQEGVIRGNWLHYRSLFDCDWVEIIQATDEDVERFAVQVGNDTDPFRQPRYQDMRCLIGPACRLSENTVRILSRMFGQVALE
ncbi:MAG: hypothetical protein JXM69_15570 [Anaerolineae bacterium]|nr:hypothetical protein [Anaerolineae bacterium]